MIQLRRSNRKHYALLATLVGALSVLPPVARAQAQAEWTLLVYMNGDNNLEPDALINFRQLAQVGGNDKVNVIVQFDRIGKYAHTTPDWKQTLRFKVMPNTQPLPASAVEDIGEANMGDGATLRQFVEWGRQKYPAKHYMLVIWDHGQGWRLFLESLLAQHRAVLKSRAMETVDTVESQLGAAKTLRQGSGKAASSGETAPFRSAPGDAYRSASNDETNDDVLFNRETEDALKAALGGQKLDVIGFDACLMSMVETAYAFRGVADYLVASEELEPGLGWKYDDIVAKLKSNPTMDGATFAKLLVDSYKSYYAGPHGDPATTMAAYKLSGAEELASAISGLSQTLTDNLDAELQHIIGARASVSRYAPDYEFYHVDLCQFLTELMARTNNPAIKTQSQKVLSLVASGVIANYRGAERQGQFGSKGLAIYFPATQHEHTTDPYAEGGYEKGNHEFPVEFVDDHKWSDFLHAFWSKVP